MYACREDGCGYSATQRVQLKTHMLTHCPEGNNHPDGWPALWGLVRPSSGH
jgi:hypothetical protein